MKKLFLFMLLTSCMPYKSVYRCSNHNTQCAMETRTCCSSLYKIIPRHRCQIHWYDFGHWTTWALFGNDDDGIFGEGERAHFKPQEPPTVNKAVKWWCRNPLHNFTFYVIGSAYRRNSAFVLFNISERGVCSLHYHPYAYKTFGSKNSSFYLALHGGKPFISLRLRYSNYQTSEFYIGWRPRGNFGIKCLPLKTKNSKRTVSSINHEQNII